MSSSDYRGACYETMGFIAVVGIAVIQRPIAAPIAWGSQASDERHAQRIDQQLTERQRDEAGH